MRAIRKFSLTLAATAVLLLLAIALTSVGASVRFKPSTPAKPSAQAAVARTMKTYTMYSGLWRTDGSFVSTIRVKNVLVVAPMDITPVLFMADGTPYPLPAVHLAVSGIATIKINDALTKAPSSVANHLSQFGSAALIYTYTSQGHVSASIASIDASRSLSYTFPFSEPTGASMMQTLEGLWWKHDRNVSGWIALSNVSDAATQATIQFASSGNAAQPAKTIALSPHTTQMFRLEDFANNPSPLVKDAGGIRVTYTGQPGSLQVNGGLENASEGYSANIRFSGHDMSSAPATSISYASAGLMFGKPDPMMMPGFPKDTAFAPYLILRNTTEKPLDVALQLNYMKGMPGSSMSMNSSAPVIRALPMQHLAPGEAKQVNMEAALSSAGLNNFNGSINLSATFTGKAGDLLLATGSVDQTGTYVFEVEPQGVSTSHSKYTNYWGVSNGNDTMYSLFNPTDTAQDILATFYYADGSGKYTLTVHLEPQASTMIDMAMLIMEKQPDSNGNVIPTNINEGSAQFESAKGHREKITLVIAAGIYNVADATCGGGCIYCCGDSGFGITPNPIYCPIGTSMYCSTTAEDCNGSYLAASSWSSSNTAVMTVDSNGNVTGVSVGSANITASWNDVVEVNGQVCGGIQFCPTGSNGGGAPANTTPSVTFSPIDYVVVGQTATTNATVNPTNNTTPISLNVTSPAAIVSPTGTFTTSTSVVVKGLTAGTATLTATIPNPEGGSGTVNIGSISFPVTSAAPTATLTQRTSGTVSTDNAALNAYQSAEGTVNIGLITVNSGTKPGCFGAFEFVGAISPSTYTGNVILHREFVSDAAYTNSTQTLGSTTPTDDTTDPVGRDDNPQSGGSGGKVYDLDAPGTGTSAPPGSNIYRYRGNFYEYATLPDGTRISSNYNFYVRVSCQKTSSGYQFYNGVSGDNQIGPGTTPLTWNLQ